MDPIEKAKGAMGGVERLISGLPGIKSYREKEMRRDADKQVRETLAHELEERRSEVIAMQRDLLDAGGLLWMDDLERLVSKLQLLADRIGTAAYGYAGFFDLQRVKETELDKLAQFDQALFDDLPKLDEAVATLQKAVQANEGIKEAVRAVSDVLASLSDTFGQRMEAIKEA